MFKITNDKRNYGDMTRFVIEFLKFINEASEQVLTFRDLTWEMVRQEGEDETFEQWKTGNYGYWTQDAARRGYIFTEETMMTFEQFEVVEVLSGYERDKVLPRPC